MNGLTLPGLFISSKKLNQKPGWAEANLEKIKKLLSDTPDGELSLDVVKQMMGGKGDLRSVQKNSMILQSIAAEQNPDGGRENKKQAFHG